MNSVMKGWGRGWEKQRGGEESGVAKGTFAHCVHDEAMRQVSEKKNIF